MVEKGLLYRVEEGLVGQGAHKQLLVPMCFQNDVLALAHEHPLAGHLGIHSTLARLKRRFFWPGIYRIVRKYCSSCPNCQLVSTRTPARTPLVPLPTVQAPMDRIAVDMIGPLEKTKRGHQYILVVLDYATRYPWAIPLRSTRASVVAPALVSIFCEFGFPREVLTDRGTNFMSRELAALWNQFGIKHTRTAAYHPQTDGLVERYNQTLKAMMRACLERDSGDWDRLIPFLLFASREVPQASTGFSPFELIFGRQPRGMLDVIQEKWSGEEAEPQDVISYVAGLRQHAEVALRMARDNLLQAQEKQKQYYDRGAREREFHEGDQVLILVPTSPNKLLAKWKGPGVIEKRLGPLNYRVRVGHKRPQVYHVNLLKPWIERESLSAGRVPEDEEELGPQVRDLGLQEGVNIGVDLTPLQRAQMERIVSRAGDVFSPLPGRTTLVTHSISTQMGKVVRRRPYRLPEAMQAEVTKQVEEMLQLGVIEESSSAWCSPIVLVPKPDGTLRFCIDFRLVNAISSFDAYPMPRVDELVERLGTAHYLTTLDLTKGYWQIPLDRESREKTAFATPVGLYHFVRMPFGLQGAAASCQRLLNIVLRPHLDYAAAYMDDVIIHSTDWASHLVKVQAVLQSLREAGLTVNPAKCRLAQREVKYLGHVVGKGVVKPLLDKIQCIRDYPRPVTQKQLRAFLGLVGYYRRFIPRFADRACPLNDMLRKGTPNQLGWAQPAASAFEYLKGALCRDPVLKAVDFALPFVLQTDASGTGLGAVLSQSEYGDEHPVLYLSRRLHEHERKYATIEKECLAVKWAIDSLKYYLAGRPFILVTDHAPLKWLHVMRDSNARLTRWYLALQPYCFEVRHRAGKDHVNADFLSRLGEGVGTPVTKSSRVFLRGGVCDVVQPGRRQELPSHLKSNASTKPRQQGAQGKMRRTTNPRFPETPPDLGGEPEGEQVLDIDHDELDTDEFMEVEEEGVPTWWEWPQKPNSWESEEEEMEGFTYPQSCLKGASEPRQTRASGSTDPGICVSRPTLEASFAGTEGGRAIPEAPRTVSRLEEKMNKKK
ncbi:uncharacterized protein LOC115083327 [Rhinatrema bivittatum]|uniref:uncharacterized protein LOC115083327 n=1 Tax=Rhinatrema bivittatum TaxID=194408 RepID=UPI00112ED8D1|nr:uncharacterized protein LOC115083327 [Rhinatrema bivittatum]